MNGGKCIKIMGKVKHCICTDNYDGRKCEILKPEGEYLKNIILECNIDISGSHIVDIFEIMVLNSKNTFVSIKYRFTLTSSFFTLN